MIRDSGVSSGTMGLAINTYARHGGDRCGGEGAGARPKALASIVRAKQPHVTHTSHVIKTISDRRFGQSTDHSSVSRRFGETLGKLQKPPGTEFRRQVRSSRSTQLPRTWGVC